jgi:hypothetical protein
MNRAEAAALARATRAARAPSLADRFWTKAAVRSADECWPWNAAPRRAGEGYGAFWLDGRHQPANRIALQLSGVEVPAGSEVCHHCDNPPCCNPRHLFLGNRQSNNADKVAKGRHAHGERNGGARLTAEAVAEIRGHQHEDGRRVAPGTCQVLAERFGVTRRYVSELMHRGWGIPR